MDWLGKMIQLPEEFLSGGKGGGVIQVSAGEATILGLLAARSYTIAKMKKKDKDLIDAEIIGKLVCYFSDEAHSSVEKACHIGAVRYHVVESDDQCCLRGNALRMQITKDKNKGLIPFYCVATLGTTSSCAFDNLIEVGSVCQDEDIWLHVDAAYAGTAFVCPEFRPLLNGVELVNSYNFNPAKWMMVNYECSALWLKDKKYLIETLQTDPLYLKHAHQNTTVDFMNWQLRVGRKFNSLKLWSVLRMYGVKGIQEHVRKGSNALNESLLKRINKDGRIFMVPGKCKGLFFIRFVVTSPSTTPDDIIYAWDTIKEKATEELSSILPVTNYMETLKL